MKKQPEREGDDGTLRVCLVPGRNTLDKGASNCWGAGRVAQRESGALMIRLEITSGAQGSPRWRKEQEETKSPQSFCKVTVRS